jgi:molybdopterin-containing oxidoreductase family iron-sulfur binding subunit
MTACPYGARNNNFKHQQKYVANPNPEFPLRMRGVVEKCSFCPERLAVGKMPACVEASDGRILFGDLHNPKSNVRKALAENFSVRRKPNLGTQPSVYYIL